MEDEEGSKEILTEQQLKYYSQVLVRLKRNSNASPFLEPVDPVKLDIPDYPLKIKHPMDLSTVKKKLDGRVYRQVDEFDADMRLMFNNCYMYNPAGSAVHSMGRALEAVYNDLMEAMPDEVLKRRRKVEQPVDRLKQPKRSAKVGEGMRAEEHEMCLEVLGDLEKTKHKTYSWPFLEPVDGSLVPDYYSVIKEPMDLQTMRGKLEQRRYGSAEEFAEDLRLIVENCRRFNAPDTEVYVCGQEFERAVDGLLQRMSPQDIRGRIVELKKKVVACTKEIRALETRLGEQGGEMPQASRTYTLSERVGLGNAILNMSRSQTEQIARIVQKHNAGEFVENDEIEVDMRMIPDSVVEEIDLYVKRTSVGIDDVQSE